MLQRFLMILVFSLLLTQFQYQNIKAAIDIKVDDIAEFYISCEGQIKIRGPWGENVEPYYEDWKIVYRTTTVLGGDPSKPVLITKLLNSDFYAGRTSEYSELVDGEGPYGNVKIINKSRINFKQNNWKDLKSYSGNISLISGNATFMIINRFDDMQDIGARASGKCQGVKELYAYVNKGKSPGSGEGDKTSGSGFFINNDGYFVTNNHVIASCNNQSKISYKGENVSARLIAKDKSLDLALLKADVSPRKYINISNDRPKKLQKVIAAGYPLGKGLSDDLKFTQGIISSLKGFEDNSSQIQIDAALNLGNSGGL